MSAPHFSAHPEPVEGSEQDTCLPPLKSNQLAVGAVDEVCHCYYHDRYSKREGYYAMRVESAEYLRKVYETFWQKLGAPKEEARIYAENLLKADLAGKSTQGLASLTISYPLVRSGSLKFGMPMTIVKEGPSFALIDGGHGTGQVIAARGMEIAIQKAKEATVGCVWIRNSNDVMRVGNYTEMALEHDFVGWAMSNGEPYVSAWGGCEPVFCTNPMSYAIPASSELPIIFDAATSSITHGGVVRAAYDKVRLPEGIVVGDDGKPVFDPTPLVADPTNRNSPIGGAILPVGIKGFGWLIWVEVLAAITSGMTISKYIPLDYSGGAKWTGGTFLMAINVGNIVPIDEFKAQVDDMIRTIKSSKLAEGFDEIVMPGERSQIEAERRRKEGIPIRDEDWGHFSAMAQEIGVDLETLRT